MYPSAIAPREPQKALLKRGTVLLLVGIPLYIALSLALFAYWVNPSLTGLNDDHIAADSSTYLYFAQSLREGRNEPFVLISMSSFPNTLWAPVFLGILLPNTAAIVAFNYAILLLVCWLLTRAIQMDLRVFLLLLFANVTTSISLISLNKEMLDLLVTSMFLVYLARGNRKLLCATLVLALFSRFEISVAMLAFVALRTRLNPFRAVRWKSLLALAIALSVVFSALLKGSSTAKMDEAMSSASSGGLLLLFDNLQLHYLFFLATVPKILDNLFSELLFVSHWSRYSLHDPANTWFLIGNNLANVLILTLLLLKRRLTLRHDLVYYAAVNSIFMSLAFIIQPRYFYGAYVVLCVEAARRRSPVARLAAAAPSSGVYATT